MEKDKNIETKEKHSNPKKEHDRKRKKKKRSKSCENGNKRESKITNEKKETNIVIEAKGKNSNEFRQDLKMTIAKTCILL